MDDILNALEHQVLHLQKPLLHHTLKTEKEQLHLLNANLIIQIFLNWMLLNRVKRLKSKSFVHLKKKKFYFTWYFGHNSLWTFSQPFHLGSGREDLLCKRHSLLLRADHACDLQAPCELQLGDALKAFLQVRLDTQRVFGLWQNLQQLLIWQEEEPAVIK